LGWFSIGLGLAEVLAPRSLTRGLGMEGHEQLMQAYGVREIATNWDSLVGSAYPVDMGARRRRCARYRHARNRTEGEESEKREFRDCPCRGRRRHGAGFGLRSFACA